MFEDHIEESGQEDSTKQPGYPQDPYEITDEEMEAQNRGGPATGDQFVEFGRGDELPDDQEVRHLEGATEQVADVDSKEWEDRVAAEEREQERENEN